MARKKSLQPRVPRFGWVPPEDRDYSVRKSHDKILESSRIFSAAGADLTDSGKGKVVLLWKFLQELCGGVFPINRQTIGDCVSHGWAKAIEMLMAVDVVLREDQQEEWPKVLTATEWIYGTSRVLVGGGRLGNSDGSLGSWASKACDLHGTLIRIKYGSHDLTRYSGSRAKDWGYRGLPARELEPTADEHPVKSALCTSYEQARDSIANGYPVTVCSNQGFTNRRDKDGFCRPSGSWPHCMVFGAVDDESSRPGLLCLNSWGEDWVSGPKRHEQPEGTFWTDADVADRMLRGQDSHAVNTHEGYKRRDIDHNPFN